MSTKAEIMDAAMRSAHHADTIANHHVPHILTHADRASTAKDPGVVSRNLVRLKKHTTALKQSTQGLTQSIQDVPGVAAETKKLTGLQAALRRVTA